MHSLRALAADLRATPSTASTRSSRTAPDTLRWSKQSLAPERAMAGSASRPGEGTDAGRSASGLSLRRRAAALAPADRPLLLVGVPASSARRPLLVRHERPLRRDRERLRQGRHGGDQPGHRRPGDRGRGRREPVRAPGRRPVPPRPGAVSDRPRHGRGQDARGAQRIEASRAEFHQIEAEIGEATERVQFHAQQAERQRELRGAASRPRSSSSRPRSS